MTLLLLSSFAINQCARYLIVSFLFLFILYKTSILKILVPGCDYFHILTIWALIVLFIILLALAYQWQFSEQLSFLLTHQFFMCVSIRTESIGGVKL